MRDQNTLKRGNNSVSLLPLLLTLNNMTPRTSPHNRLTNLIQQPTSSLLSDVFGYGGRGGSGADGFGDRIFCVFGLGIGFGRENDPSRGLSEEAEAEGGALAGRSAPSVIRVNIHIGDHFRQDRLSRIHHSGAMGVDRYRDEGENSKEKKRREKRCEGEWEKGGEEEELGKR